MKNKRAWNTGLNKENNEIMFNISLKLKGRIAWNKDDKTKIIKKCLFCKNEFESYAYRNQKFCSRSCVTSGIFNPHWNFDRKYVEYSPEFYDKKFRQQVLEDQRFFCAFCWNEYGTKRFDLHHIDYNKRNDGRENLIFLCVNCHNRITKSPAYYKQWWEMISKSFQLKYLEDNTILNEVLQWYENP